MLSRSAVDVGGKADVSMDLLLGALEGDKSINVVKKKLDDLDKGAKAPKFVSKVVSDRVSREVTYDATSKEVGKWQEFVTTNRHASTLDLANDKREVASARGLVKKFEPRTDMENEIQMILVKSNTQSDKAIEQHEVDELKQRDVSEEDIKERQQELQKVKSLLFYEQLKRHRINKIKSKAYHRIKKRQRLRKEDQERELALQSEDPAMIEQVQEEEAMRRVKERMTMKHQNTGKWAKMALIHGKHDKNLRNAYHEAVQYGNELASKMHNLPANEGESSDSGPDSDSNSDEDEDAPVKTSEAAAKQMAKIFDNAQESNASEYAGKYKKIFEMDFMKKAAEQQREKAKLEAQNILKELKQMEMDEEQTEFDESNGTNEEADEQSEEMLKQASDTINDLFKDSESGGNAMSIDVTNKRKGVMSTVMLSSEPKQDMRVPKHKNISKPQSVVVESSTPIGGSRILPPKSFKKTKNNATVTTEVSGATPSGTSTTTEAVETPAPVENEKKTNAKKQLVEKKPLILQKTQEDLVQMAFAGPDLEEEFKTMKQEGIDAELGIDEKKKKILSQVKSGWGDWAGPGNTGISDKILKKRDRLLKISEAEADEKRKQRADVKNKNLYNVMISDRRVKTAAKYKIDEIPHPFTTREEYERSLQMPIGGRLPECMYIFEVYLMYISLSCYCRGMECNQCCSPKHQTRNHVACWSNH